MIRHRNTASTKEVINNEWSRLSNSKPSCPPLCMHRHESVVDLSATD
jgi:hypothetical protein